MIPVSFRAQESCMKLTDFDDCSRQSFEGLLSKPGRLGEMYKTIVMKVRYNPGLTAKELWSLMVLDERNLFNNEFGDFKPRLTELKKAGDIIKVGTRSCTVMGTTCSIYEVNK